MPNRDALDAMELVLEDLHVEVRQEADTLIITDPDTGMPLGGEWIGCWEKVTSG